MVAAVCAAETLGLAGYSIVPALLPQFIDDWSLSNAQGGWLAGMVLAGYMLVNCLFGLVPELPYGTVVWLALIAGIICPGKLLQSHFAHLVVAAPRQLGATMALYSCMRFGGGFVGALMFGVALAGSPAWWVPSPPPFCSAISAERGRKFALVGAQPFHAVATLLPANARSGYPAVVSADAHVIETARLHSEAGRYAAAHPGRAVSGTGPIYAPWTTSPPAPRIPSGMNRQRN